MANESLSPAFQPGSEWRPRELLRRTARMSWARHGIWRRRAAALHPGTIHTELARHVDARQIEKIIEQRNQQLAAEGKAPFQWKTIPQGAATSVWASVVAPADEIGGRYCEDCHVGKIVPDHVPTSAIIEGVRGYALDEKNAEALWKKSEELVGESF